MSVAGAPLKVPYTCRACLISNVKVDVPERGAEQEMDDWVRSVLSPAVAADHNRRSPRCRNRKLDARVPESGRKHLFVEDPAPDPERSARHERRRAELERLVSEAGARHSAVAYEMAASTSAAHADLVQAEQDLEQHETQAAIQDTAATCLEIEVASLESSLLRAREAVGRATASAEVARQRAAESRAAVAAARVALDAATSPHQAKVQEAKRRVDHLRYRLQQHEARQPAATAAPALFVGAEAK